MENFDDGREVRIDAAQARVTSRPGLAGDVGKRIHAKAVEPRGFNPPDAVLQEILRDDGIFRVHVRQRAENQPSVRLRRRLSGACGSASTSKGSLPMDSLRSMA